MNIEERRRLSSVVMSNVKEIWGYKTAEVPLECMVVDVDKYQRKHGVKVKDIAENFDRRQVGFLEVSLRDGLFHIIDGQNRFLAGKLINLETLPCIIYTDLTVEDEALMFARQQNNVTKLRTYDIYKANICNGNRNIPEVNTDMIIHEISELTYGIPVVPYYGNGLTDLFDARDIASRDTVEFDWIISLLSESRWLVKNKRITKRVITSLSRCYRAAENKQIAYANLMNILSKYETNIIQTLANMRYPALNESPSFANLMLDIVNNSVNEEEFENIIPIAS